MTYARKTKCVVARCPERSWSKCVFGPHIQELRLKAALETLTHVLTARFSTQRDSQWARMVWRPQS